MIKAKTLAVKFTLVLLCIIMLSDNFCIIAMAKLNTTQNISIEYAVSLALANDRQLKKMNNQVILKKAQYMQAVESVKAKWKDYNSFRWTPLFSFKFPSKPYMVDAFELAMKAYLVDNESKFLRRQISDRRIELTSSTQTLFNDIYILQEKLKYEQEVYDIAKADYARNKARTSAGLGKQEDVLKLERKVKACEKSISTITRDVQSHKEKLSDKIGIDVTTNYSFNNPLSGINISRSVLPEIIDYTLDKDLIIYEARSELTIATENLEQYQKLYQSKYGGFINYIIGDIQASKNGRPVDFDAFKERYDQMLKAMENPWEGHKKILFFRIPKIWFKGKLDGTRYIDDEKYALYVSTMEYDDAMRGEAIAVKEITNSIKENFETLITLENSYETSLESVKTEKNDLARLRELNKVGKAEFSELDDQLVSYQDSQIKVIEDLAAYCNQISAFDRLTCGAVTKLKSGASIATDTDSGGDSYADMQTENKPYYYIDMAITELKFMLGVVIPDEYSPSITHYELWYENQQIGKRTPIEKQIIHMPIVYQDTNKMTIRVYDGDKFVDEADIDVTIARDNLKFKKSNNVILPQPKSIGKFISNIDAVTGRTTITFDMFPYENIAKYLVTTEDGTKVYDTESIEIAEKFIYLGFAVSDLSKLKVNFYDANDIILYTATFDTSTGRMMSIPEAPK